ncbi:MAG: 7TM domain-containing protein [Patescibacteria group bacterium]
MNIKFLLTALVAPSLLCACIMPAAAQELPTLETLGPLEQETNELSPAITSDEYIAVNKKALFDASESTLLDTTAEPVYRWDFSDVSGAQFGKEVVHEFEQTGIHRITLTIQQGEFRATAEKEIFAYDKKIFMVTDRDVEQEFQLIVNQAAHNGVLLKIVSGVEEETGFLTEEKLVPLISEESEFIREADVLLFYADSSLGLQGFTRYWQSLDADKKIDLKQKLIIKISDQNMGIAAKLAQQSFEVMDPQYIIVTRKEALNPIFENDDANLLTTEFDRRAIEYRIVDARSEKPYAFFLSHAVTNFIAKGIPTNTIYLILAFPFIAFVVTFARQVIGLSSFGVFTPSLIALALIILGIYFGIGTLIVVIVVSYLLRLILNKFKLLYIPKTALILSVTALSFLGIIWFLSYYRVSLAVSLAIFPMLVMSTISEKFISAQSEEGFREALFGVFTTVLLAIAGYYLVVWNAFNDLIMSWPELIILPLIGMVLIGKFTGLRLTEYFRFRSLFKEKNVEE